MTDKALKKEIVKWAAQIGRRAAVKRMILLDLSPAMAEKLARGKYDPTPHVDTAAKLIAELAKDGFKLAGEKAS